MFNIPEDANVTFGRTIQHVHVEGHPELSINFNRPFLFAEDSDQALNVACPHFQDPGCSSISQYLPLFQTLKETLETIDIPIYLKNTLFISDTVTVTTRVNSPLGHPPVNRCETGRDTPCPTSPAPQTLSTTTVQLILICCRACSLNTLDTDILFVVNRLRILDSGCWNSHRAIRID
ncbi:hypothetical protein BLNAU_23044 [Blattamonas nauphoetae]|uniref:Uncharacterized protein n=1 Tax=Blattamonas nauphoetae TaxID=2049346 RepID=A0ABQ9WRB7_9EUKA|nr:hypothetical protein BLNAU_23044 [Blattamonas nauphoetae]